MTDQLCCSRAQCRDRRGFALPVALMGLLAVSLLVMGLIIGASTDTALSVAHRTAAEDIYLAEGAIEAWVGERRHLLEETVVASWTPPGGAVPVRIEVERLSRRLPGDPGTGVNALFAVHAVPARPGGGRGVVALVRTRQVALPEWDPRIDAAIVSGAGGRLAGSLGDLVVRDGRDSPLCSGAGSQATDAAFLAAGATLSLEGGVVVEGDVSMSGMNRNALLEWTLPGTMIRDLAWGAEIRFGRFFNEDELRPGSMPASGHSDPRLDWGCPRDVVDHIRAEAPGMGAPAPCPAGADTSRYVAVAMDAGNAEVVLSGQHGQGLLIVVNGDLHLTGSFVFKGMIVAERDVIVSGAGSGWPPSIEGAVVSGGRVVIDRARTPPESGAGGSRAVRFNRCAVDRVRDAFNVLEDGGWRAPRVLGRTHGWFEVLR